MPCTELKLEAHRDGVLLLVRAQPGRRREGIQGLNAGALKLAVTQVAEDGKANKALVKSLQGLLGLRPGDVELLSGTTSPQKRFLVRTLSFEEIRQRLAANWPAS